MKYWLMKSEPDVFSIDALKAARSSVWDGVRNYQARNFMTNDMQEGDEILFYHSNADPSGVAGVARVVGSAVPDPTQFDKKSAYFEPRASKEKPIWFGVKIGYVAKFPRVVALSELRAQEPLKNMLVLKKAQRLSIQPVSKKEFDWIVKLAKV